MGFHLSNQIQRLDPIPFHDIVRDSTRVACNNTPLANDRDQIMHETWTEHMTNGFFILYPHRASGSASSFSKLRPAILVEDELH